MGRQKTVPTSVTMVMGGLGRKCGGAVQGLVSMATSSSACEPATKYYQRLPATGQGTHLYGNADAAHSGQYTNTVTNTHTHAHTQGTMLSTVFISVAVSEQVNGDISIRNLRGGKNRSVKPLVVAL